MFCCGGKSRKMYRSSSHIVQKPERGRRRRDGMRVHGR